MPANTTGWWAEFHAFINARTAKVNASLSATQNQEANIGITLQKITATLTGVEHPKGDLVGMIREINGVFNGEHAQVGDLATELRKISAAMSGKQSLGGPLNANLHKLVANLTGYQKQTGAIAASLQKVSASINGYERPLGGLILPVKKTNIVLVGKHYQTGTIAANLKKTSASLSGIHKQTGTIAAAFKKASTSLNGTHTQRGQVAANLQKFVAAFNGTFTGVTPVVFDVLGTPGSENLGDITCTINPTAGSDVLIFASSGGASLYAATFGAGSTKARLLGRVKFLGGQYTVFLVRGVSSGSQTATVKYGSGGGWAQCVAISYTGAVDWKLVKTVFGSGSTASQSTTPGSNGLSVQGFASADDSIVFSSLTGGVARLNEVAGFDCFTIRETNISNTFGASLSSSVPWGGVVCEATPSSISGPKINHCVGMYTEEVGGTRTFDVPCASGDYVIAAIAQASPGDPSAVTCAGSAMTLIDTQAVTTGSGTGFVKVYRSASAMGSAGDKTVSFTTSGGGWLHVGGCSVTNAASFSAATKSSGTSSAPTQAMTCSAGQLILHFFVLVSAPQTVTGTNMFDSPGGSQIYLHINAAHESTTFGVSNTMNWGSMGIVIS